MVFQLWTGQILQIFLNEGTSPYYWFYYIGYIGLLVYVFWCHNVPHYTTVSDILDLEKLYWLTYEVLQNHPFFFMLSHSVQMKNWNITILLVNIKSKKLLGNSIIWGKANIATQILATYVNLQMWVLYLDLRATRPKLRQMCSWQVFSYLDPRAARFHRCWRQLIIDLERLIHWKR